ncbi:MAG: hypothetical protein KTR22_09455 [Flavobacteriaceae bacterium]|nr:hypothetical protein [Flavobacteriaceae bacterium]
MKYLLLLCCFTLCTQFELLAQEEFDLDPSQSMLMTGKGPGQDGTINPYAGEDCYAVVENFGTREFSIRIQKKGEIIKSIPVAKGETKKVKLLKGQELYLDSSSEGVAKARVDYEKMEKQ